MWVFDRKREVMALVHMPCPACRSETIFQILKRRTKALYIVVPWFSTKYYAMCGNCYTIFRITEQGAEEAKMAPENGSDAEYNLRSCPKCGSFNSVKDKSCGICRGKMC